VVRYPRLGLACATNIYTTGGLGTTSACQGPADFQRCGRKALDPAGGCGMAGARLL